LFLFIFAQKYIRENLQERTPHWRDQKTVVIKFDSKLETAEDLEFIAANGYLYILSKKLNIGHRQILKIRHDKKTVSSSFQVEKRLGEGKAGEVYSITIHDPILDLQQGDRIAVKIYKPQILEYSNQEKRIEREFRVGSTLRHPNLIEIYHMDFSYIDDILRPYLLMELLDGITLREYVRKNHPLSENQIVNLIQQLCSAACYLHEIGLVHRDIKPENIMILHNGKLKLMDFGVLKDLNATSLTDSNQFLGTIRYAAPEYLFDLNATEKSDAYSIGAILYFLIYGHDIFHEIKPFAKFIRKISLSDPPIYKPDRSSSKRLSLLLEITRRLLLKTPEERSSLNAVLSKIRSGFEGKF
jgi:serine/threonine protein kinase